MYKKNIKPLNFFQQISDIIPFAAGSVRCLLLVFLWSKVPFPMISSERPSAWSCCFADFLRVPSNSFWSKSRLSSCSQASVLSADWHSKRRTGSCPSSCFHSQACLQEQIWNHFFPKPFYLQLCCTKHQNVHRPICSSQLKEFSPLKTILVFSSTHPFTLRFAFSTLFSSHSKGIYWLQ